MRSSIVLILVVITHISAFANKYNYSFNNAPISEAIVRICKDNPELNISFIYKELDNYKTSASIQTDDVYEALREVIGLNPISIIRRNQNCYIEALQHGRFCYTGQTIDKDSEPVVAATVLILSPKDSTVLTYGITDDMGRFTIPCDKQDVIAKLSCVGYKTTYKKFDSFNVGTILMSSSPIKLQTVNVEAENTLLLSDKSIYRPTQRQKNASQNVVDLLRLMAIPQIQINPISDEVTDNAGNPISIFINYLEASKEEMEGMRMSDVRFVEYIEFPTDPRFHGKLRIINIIVQEYEYGGYTKFTTNENFLIGLSSRNNVFSKFSYKKMTYDFYAGADNFNNHILGSNIKGIYTLKDANGKDYNLVRTQTVKSSHFKKEQYPVTVRATYSSEKIQIRNTVGFTHYGTPIEEQRGELTYQNNRDQNYTYYRNNPSKKNSLTYQGSFFFVLPNQFSIDFSPRFNYMHNNDYFAYSTNSTDIVRNARENVYNYEAYANLQKRIGQKQTLSLGIGGGDNINRLQYSGTNSYYDRFHSGNASCGLGYKYNTKKISVYVSGGIGWLGSDINGTKMSDITPFSHLNIRYVPNKKNAISAYLQYATNFPGINMKVSDILRENEYMYITGNTLLKNNRHVTLNLSYNWAPSNNFGLNAFSNTFGMLNRQIMSYEPYKDGSVLLRTYINSGNYFQSELGFSANWKLLDGKLQIFANPKQFFFKSTGIYNKYHSHFSIKAQAIYYLNSIYFKANYESATMQMFTGSPQLYKDRNFHSFSIGWANSNWNVRVMAVNFFNKGRSCANIVTESPLYTEYKENVGTTVHPRLNITATYTFGYGKKLKRNNEVGEQKGANSAIIK
ncbi:MAG: hypothetical protein K2K27_02995 [Muribaculaceae bacterium]|nr:hypothetical protein [Muribaculaceae bacterium]